MRESTATVKTPFLTDEEHPLDSTGDQFSHVDYVDVIGDAVNELPSPFTLGLFGAWGTGKSSILRAVGRRVDEPSRTAFVLFDAWKYEGDPLRRQFMIEVVRQLKRGGHLRRRFDVRRHLERYDADVTGSRPRFEFDWRSLVRAIVLAALAVAAVYGLYALLADIGVSERNALKTALAAVTGGLTFVLTLLGTAFVVQRQQITRRRLADADEFADSFQTLLSDGLKAPRLVIGIDNLDRCAPEKVTELLATMKTYLEPARKGTALAFIVAADDHALRRHLIAQEMSVSAATATGTQASPDQRVPDDVVDAVDEYLRKYFNAVIRLGDFIDEDLERFVSRQLDGFAVEHRLSEWTRSALQQLVIGHLGGNPRRIKQFVNGLHFRYALLKRRRERKRLAETPDVLTVAELMVLEERWPDRFKELRRDTHEAREWRDRLLASETEQEHGWDGEWVRFLTTSRRVLTYRVSPYISLKQSEAEAALELYARFIAALETGQAAEVQNVLATVEDLAPYRDLIKRRFWKHFNRDRYGVAFRVLKSAAGPPAFVDDPALAEMVGVALRHSTLRDWLPSLGPETLLGIASRLAAHERGQLVRQVLTEFGRADEEGSRLRRKISEELAARPELLNEEIWKAVRTMIARPEILQDRASWSPLAAVGPELRTLLATDDTPVDNRQHPR
jgi:hypothetical protein